MPDKPTTVAAYAAGASLAAITLFYVFSPTFFIDGENSYNTSDGRKRTIIGLMNPANDCFINSVLQALAGLGDLRLYLIRELHRRTLDGPEIYETVPNETKKGEKPQKTINLQRGPVTKALKLMLDALNERPIYKKTITARPLIEALEKAFQTRLSRNQQDAQEFLQIVAERLCDEYHAAEHARKRASTIRSVINGTTDPDIDGDQRAELESNVLQNGGPPGDATESAANADGFPFEGKLESQIQCQYCGFKNRPTASSFVSLTLNVPQKSSTTLDQCFDILLKSEEIDDFKCDRCRLKHALEWKENKLRKARSEKEQEALQQDISRIQQAIVDDPEKLPENMELPDSSHAPKRKIKKHMRITFFPKIVAIHLSRSVFDPGSYSTKNLAKVSYPERLRLGGILDEKWYKLFGIVCHKGSHNSGHYESFRRNHLYPPFATPGAFSAYASASRIGSATPSADPSPKMGAKAPSSAPSSPESSRSTLSIPSATASPATSRPSSQSVQQSVQSSPSQTSMSNPSRHSDRPTSSPLVTKSSPIPLISTRPRRRKKKSNDRWWRISDEKIKEARTSEVLSMQREVYMLFYELERAGDDDLS